jgi:hypothetical protein
MLAAALQELTGFGLAMAVMAALALAVLGVFLIVDKWWGGP